MDVCVLVRKTYELLDGTPVEVHQDHVLQTFQPLSYEQYALPNKLSNLGVNEANQKRERIRQEELECLQHRYVCRFSCSQMTLSAYIGFAHVVLGLNYNETPFSMVFHLNNRFV